MHLINMKYGFRYSDEVCRGGKDCWIDSLWAYALLAFTAE